MTVIEETYEIATYRPMCFWTASDVDDWLRRRRPKLALKYSLNFLRHGINGRVLMDITDGDLTEIGINCYDERQDLLLEIRKEKLYSDSDELSKLIEDPSQENVNQNNQQERSQAVQER